MRNALPLIAIAFLLWFGLTQRPDVGPDVDPPPDVKALIDADGLHVLIVEEKDDRRNLPVKQASVLIPSSQLTGWLKDHKGQWRIFDDDDQDVSQDDPKWQKALKELERESLPWIYIQHDRKPKFSGPLPGSVEDTIALLEKSAQPGRGE